jgi:hypothetical protein
LPTSSPSRTLTPIQTVGAFEFEFQSATADTVTVTENKTPAAPPTGFELLETSSYQVALATSKGVGLTLSKIDFVFDAASEYPHHVHQWMCDV